VAEGVLAGVARSLFSARGSVATLPRSKQGVARSPGRLRQIRRRAGGATRTAQRGL
jgi:hypothetical protein